MEKQTFQRDSESPFSPYRTKQFRIDDDAIVINGNEKVDLPKQCIYCSENKFLNRRENQISSKKNFFQDPKVLVSYYLCEYHSRVSEKNGYLVTSWLLLAIMGLRFFPLKLCFLPIIISGYFLLKTVIKNSQNLLLKKYENGNFWITGVSPEFLAKLNSVEVWEN